MTVKESFVKKHKHFNVEHFQIPELLSSGSQLYKQSQIIATFCLWQQNSQGCHFFFFFFIAHQHKYILRGEDCSACEKEQENHCQAHTSFLFFGIQFCLAVTLFWIVSFCICGYIVMKLFVSSFRGSLWFKRQGVYFKYCFSTRQISLSQN